jgi:subtilisin family serine protease
VTHVRTRFALSLLAAWTLLAAVPALASADLGHQVVFHAASTPHDGWWGTEWGLENSGSTAFVAPLPATADADIDAQQAWDNGYDGTGTTVAVVDTRIDVTNPDIAPQLSTTIPAGQDVAKFAGCTRDTPPDHGTAVAGVVAAARDNNLSQGVAQGIAGVAPGAEIVPVPALDDCGDGTPESVMDAFRYAVDNNVHIVVASFATDPLLPHVDKDAIASEFGDFFNAHTDTLFVVAAGNEGNNNDDSPVYPCSSDAPNVVCVGASTPNDSPSCESNVGANSVDLFAPGEDIYSDFWTRANQPNPYIQPLSGTSMAAPMVAGVAAMVAPYTTPGDASVLAQALRGGVDPRDAMNGMSMAQGRLDAVGALTAANRTLTPGPDGGELPSRTGDGNPWLSCDTDHDGMRTANCVTSEGHPDSCDNCPHDVNPDQADADGDDIGDACDSTPRGDDTDGDGIPRLDDACPSQAGTASHRGCPDSDGDGIIDSADSCPYQYAATANGCPVAVATPTPTPPPVVTPTPTPTVTPIVPLRIESVAVRVAHNRKTARVTVQLTRTAGTLVTVERRVRRGHRHVWTRVLRRSFSATAGGRGLTVRTHTRGSYRVTVVLAGARTVRRNFRV